MSKGSKPAWKGSQACGPRAELSLPAPLKQRAAWLTPFLPTPSKLKLKNIYTHTHFHRAFPDGKPCG